MRGDTMDIFDKLDELFDNVDDVFDKIDDEFDDFTDKLEDKLEDKMDKMEDELDELEDKIDNRFNKSIKNIKYHSQYNWMNSSSDIENKYKHIFAGYIKYGVIGIDENIHINYFTSQSELNKVLKFVTGFNNVKIIEITIGPVTNENLENFEWKLGNYFKITSKEKVKRVDKRLWNFYSENKYIDLRSPIVIVTKFNVTYLSLPQETFPPSGKSYSSKGFLGSHNDKDSNPYNLPPQIRKNISWLLDDEGEIRTDNEIKRPKLLEDSKKTKVTLKEKWKIFKLKMTIKIIRIHIKAEKER
jgi:ElaB/YqjD/DUF883 family membrane-anchored ribosome-binding protein